MPPKQHGKSEEFILQQPTNNSKTINRRKKAGNKKENLSIGAFLLVGLTCFFCMELIFVLTTKRPFHILWVTCLLTSVLTVFFAEKFPPDIAKKIRLTILTLIISWCGLFIAYYQIPISSFSLTIYPVTKTTEFILRQFIPNNDDILTKIYGAPTLQKQIIEFRLPNEIRKQSKNLRLYLGRHPGSYDIIKLSFGTMILWQPIALINYTGKNIYNIAGTEKTLNHLDFMNNNKIRLTSMNRSRPMLNIRADEFHIRQDITARRKYAVKLFWFFLCAGSSTLIIKYRTPSRIKRWGKKTIWTEYLIK